MFSNRLRALAVFATLVGGLIFWMSRSVAQEQGNEQLNKAKLVESARLTLEVVQMHYEVGQATAVEDIYRWSRRLCKAQLRAEPASDNQAAIDSHLKRMRELHGKVAALNRAEAQGGEAAALHATEYYVAEAESF